MGKENNNILNNFLIKSPCKECKKRTATCHGDCSEYLEFRKKLEKIKGGKTTPIPKY